MGRDRCRRGRADRGFSLIELGIVIAVVAILAGVVIAGQGFITASKERTTIDLVLTIRKAAQQFAQRHQHGLAYGNPAGQAEDNVSYKQLRADNFLPTNLLTPWEPGPTAADNDIQVSPNNSAVPKICAGYACVEIQISLGTATTGTTCNAVGQDLINGLTAQAVTVTCNGTVLDAVMR